MSDDRIGEIGYNKFGRKMTIIEYNSSKDIVIQFEDGYITKGTYGNFKKRLIKNPFDRTIYGIGFIGIDSYYKDKNVSSKKSYNVWRDMMYRCYSPMDKRHIKYEGCSVCEDWHNYKNFEDWFNKNYYKIDNEKTHLDKDILVDNNKVYSPDTSIFVPQMINQLFITKPKRKNGLPRGVEKWGEKFVSRVGNGLEGGFMVSEPFDTFEEARQNYINVKKNYIKTIAYHYKDSIPNKLYLRLLEHSEVYNGEW